MEKKRAVLSEIQNSDNITGVLLTEFFNMHPDSEVRAVLHDLIANGKVNATDALVNYIKRLKTEDTIYAMSISIREGADVNAYITSEGVIGSIHLIGYYHLVNDILNNYYELGLILLLASGSSPYKHSFLSTRQNGETVIEWLRSKGLSSFTESIYPDLEQNFSEETRQIIAILTGRIDLLNKKLSHSDVITAIKSRATQSVFSDGNVEVDIVSLFPLNIHTVKGPDPKILIESVFNFDVRSVSYYISHGINISYPLANLILNSINLLYSIPTLRNSLVSILGIAVDFGYNINTEQRILLSLTGQEVSSYVMNLYSVPYWKKHCKGLNMLNNAISEKTVRIAKSLGYVGTSENICSFLNNITLSNSEDLISALINRQKARVGSRYGNINEFTTLTPPVLGIVNKEGTDPYYYVDEYVVFYRDSSGKTWAWDSSFFQTLLKSGRNPSNNTELPTLLLREIAYKLELITNPQNPKLWVDLINELNQPDTINNENSDLSLSIMIDDLVNKGIPSSVITQFDAIKLAEIICSVRCDYRLEKLTNSNALITFAYIYNYYNLNNKMISDAIAAKIQQFTKLRSF